MKNNFREGQEIICISEDFPLIRKYGGTGEEPIRTPEKGEILIVCEILGDFLRFGKYDTNEIFNWWKFDRFRKLTELEERQCYEDEQHKADEIINVFDNW